MKFINCVQGTPDWFAARAGVITASMARVACETLKNGDPSQASKDYAYRVAVEQIYGETTEDVYQTWEMRRGTELEPVARICYEAKTGNLAQESGIVLTDDGVFGYSTDGFVDDDGLIEIKCPNAARKIVEMWETSNLDEYMHQIQFGLWITSRKWCDFILYAPQLERVGKHLFVKRVERDEDFIERMEAQLVKFFWRVQGHVDKLGGTAIVESEKAAKEAIEVAAAKPDPIIIEPGEPTPKYSDLAGPDLHKIASSVAFEYGVDVKTARVWIISAVKQEAKVAA